ncbi:MAG: ankyrin repeat domain-containing protein [candidate division WOR-3 bacterium]|nr:MAG: ankyrin repeat domain-containing protein [candidate division WOR-3 bacterium]
MKNGMAFIQMLVCAIVLLTFIPAMGAEIHDVSQQGDIDSVKTLVQAEPELVNLTDETGNTPLHYAVAGGQAEVVKFLISNGADVNALNTANQSVLLYAAYFGNAEITEALIADGATLNDRDVFGRSPLHYAARQRSVDAMMLLIDHKAELDIRDSIGETPLHFAVRWGYDDIAEMLIDGGAALNITTEDGKSYLHMASIKGYSAVADLLINRGMQVSAMDITGRTPLYYAAKYGNEKVAEILSVHGAKEEEMEMNFGPSPLLQKELKKGEAFLWYLGHSGVAIKTKNNLLIFDYWNYGQQPDEPCLANGHINTDEIKGQKVTVFVTHNHIDHHDSVIYYWQESIPNITYIFGWSDSTNTDYTRIGPRETTKIGEIEIKTIQSPEAEEAGGTFVVSVDGLVIFHQGGYSHDTTQYDLFKKDIQYLGETAKGADILFLRIGNDWQNEEALLAIEAVEPKVAFPFHARERESVYRNFAEQAADRSVKVQIVAAENRGDRYFYTDGRIVE